MTPVEYTYTCGQCKGTRFPEGMIIYACPRCKSYIHPGCWEKHVAFHLHNQEQLSSESLEPRRGKISAYGIIQWDNS